MSDRLRPDARLRDHLQQPLQLSLQEPTGGIPLALIARRYPRRRYVFPLPVHTSSGLKPSEAILFNEPSRASHSAETFDCNTSRPRMGEECVDEKLPEGAAGCTLLKT